MARIRRGGNTQKSSYEVRGYDDLEDYEIGYQARHLIDVSNKKYALTEAMTSLKDFLIVSVVCYHENEDSGDTIIFTRNKLLAQYLQKGLKSFPKKELPLLLGIDKRLDGYVIDLLKE